VAKKYPDDLKYKVEYAYVIDQSGMHKKAEKLYNKAIKSLKSNRADVVDLANAFKVRGMMEYALKTFDKGKKMIAQPPLNMELADLYIAQKQYDKAINLLETAFQEYPDNKDILNTLANIFLTIRKYTDAKPWIRKIIDIQPNDTLYFTLGSIYDYEHLPDSAKINYERALVLNPKNRDALYNLGVLFYLKAIKEIKMENSSKSLSDNIKAMLEQSREYLEKSFAIDNKNIEMVKILIGISKLLDNNKLEKKYKKIFENLNK